MSSIRTHLQVPAQPWETAKARFLDGLSLHEVKLYENATLENIFYDASSRQKQHAVGSRSWRLQERMSSLTQSIDEYGKALDVFVNTYPLIMSPMWGALRVVLHVSCKHYTAVTLPASLLNMCQVTCEAGKFQDSIVDMLAQIGDPIPRYRIYEALYKKHERLVSALSWVYLDVMRFCVATKDFFAKARKSRSTLVNFLFEPANQY